MQHRLACAAAASLVVALGVLWYVQGKRSDKQTSGAQAGADGQNSTATATAQDDPLPPRPPVVEPVVVAGLDALPPPAPVVVDLPPDVAQALEHIRLESETRRDVPPMPYAEDFDAPRPRMPYADEDETLPIPRAFGTLEIEIDLTAMADWSALLLPAICWKEAGQTMLRTIVGWLPSSSMQLLTADEVHLLFPEGRRPR